MLKRTPGTGGKRTEGGGETQVGSRRLACSLPRAHARAQPVGVWPAPRARYGAVKGLPWQSAWPVPGWQQWARQSRSWCEQEGSVGM